MALTRSMLKAMAIEEEKIEEIINAHAETVNALKAQRDEYKENSDKLPAVQKELDALKSAGDDGFKKKFEDTDAELQALKATVAAEKANAEKRDLVKEVLHGINLDSKRLDTVLKCTDLSKIEVKDGKIVDADKLTESMKTEWADFIVKSGASGAGVDTPPSGDGSVTKEAFDKMSLSEKMTFANEHPTEYMALSK